MDKVHCSFTLIDMKEGQSGPERESEEPKQRAVDRERGQLASAAPKANSTNSLEILALFS